MNGSILEKIRDSRFSLTALTGICPELDAMKEIPQNPEYHAEGDVYRHTEMVCEKLIKLSKWQEADPVEQEILLLAAAFHDIGKPVCTKLEEGKWISPGHTIVGEKEFRRMVYQDSGRFGLTFSQREIVAKLIRHHGLPVWFWTKKRPERGLIQAAESIPLRLLYLLAKADGLGRLGSSREEFLEQIELFADPYTRFQYFQKEDLWRGAGLYDDTEFDVILMSGLPLAGKDSWIEKNGGNIPVISLDDIREEFGFSPAKGSDKAAHIALERAKVYLRRKEPFIWNATNIIRETRRKLVNLFAGYGARVHILYLEVPYQELLARNRTRARCIPEPVLEKMIRKLELPEPWEAYEVRYLTAE